MSIDLRGCRDHRMVLSVLAWLKQLPIAAVTARTAMYLLAGNLRT
jgi:hypothetical protein